MEKILISACLIGDKTRYDGHSNYSPLIKELLEKYELVPFCSEVEGGLPTPRKPSERRKDKVLNQDCDIKRWFSSLWSSSNPRWNLLRKKNKRDGRYRIPTC